VAVAVVLAPDTFIACGPRNSHQLIDEITLGDLIRKPGWIRMSIHPTTTNAEIEFVCNGIISLAENHKFWALDYDYNSATNEFVHKNAAPLEDDLVKVGFLYKATFCNYHCLKASFC
jgi:hypothetical protein